MKLYICCQNCLTRIAAPARDGDWHCPKCGVAVHVRGIELPGGRLGMEVETEIDAVQTVWGLLPLGDGVS